MKKIFGIILFVVINYTAIFAQYNDDRLLTDKMYEMETEHFKIIFPLSMKNTVNQKLQTLETVYDTITKIYDYKPSNKTTLIVKDEDISNGWAAASVNNFSIWPTASEYLLRGTSDWKRDVITHEFSHIITIAPSYRFKPFLADARAGFVSDLSSKKVFTVASGAIPFSSNPMWFLEGIAQYSSFLMDGDKYDSHRKMILRSDAYYDNLLPLDEMQVFSKDALGSERVYNHGFSLVKYIAEKYSLKTVSNIIKRTGSVFSTGFTSAFKKETGDDLDVVYKQWADSLKIEAKERKASIKNIEGEKLFNIGFYNVFPQFRDNRVWFTSTMNFDFGPLSLASVPIEYDDSCRLKLQNDSLKVYKWGVNYSFSLAKDSSFYLYSKMEDDGTNQKQLYIAHKKRVKNGVVEYKKEKKLKKLKRIIYTSINPKNDSLFAFVMAKPGYNLIGVANIKGKILSITDTVYNEFHKPYIGSVDDSVNSQPTVVSKDRAVMFGLNWLDSTRIVFSYYQNPSRDLGIYDYKKNRASSLPINTKYDDRDPSVYKDKILYSSDRNGAFNIYSYDILTGENKQITDVLTGAFMPSATDSLLLFSMYGKKGYEIRLLKDWENAFANSHVKIDSLSNNQNIASKTKSILGDGSLIDNAIDDNYLFQPRYYTETSLLKMGRITKYKVTPSNYLISPMIFSDKYGYSRTLKLGLSAFFFDPLMKFNIGLFGAYDVTKIGKEGAEFDVGVMSEIKLLPWTIALEFFYSRMDSRVNYRSEYDGEFEQDSVMYNSFYVGLNNRYQFKGDWKPYKFHLFGSYTTSGTTHYDNPYLKLNYNFYHGFSAGVMFSKFKYIPSKEFGINPIGTFAKLKLSMNVDSLIFESSNAFDVFYVTPNGILKTRNNGFVYPKLEFDFRKYFSVPKATFLTGGITTKFNFSFMNEADSFFHNPNSGFLGISSYPLKKDSANWGYSGMYNMYVKGELRFPILKHIGKSLSFIYLDRLYGSVFGEFAYSESSTEDVNFKRFFKGLKGVGASVRLETTFGSSYPWYIEGGASFPIESTPQFEKYIINIKASMSLDGLENFESPF